MASRKATPVCTVCAYTPVFVLKTKGCGSAGENQGLFIKAATVKALP